MSQSNKNQPNKSVYLGNVPYDADEQTIREFFGDRTVTSVKIINDRETGRPRGFAFAELASREDLESAIQDLDGSEMGGRRIVVNEARVREKQEGGGSNRRQDRNREPKPSRGEQYRSGSKRDDDDYNW